jgi:acyl-CoA dehydrogenase
VGSPPSDRLGAQVARLLTRPGPARERLTAGIFLPTDASEPLARVERAFRLAAEAAPVLDRLREAGRHGTLPKASTDQLETALAAGLIDSREAGLVREAAAARLDAIQVDSFAEAEYLRRGSPASAEEREPVGAHGGSWAG